MADTGEEDVRDIFRVSFLHSPSGEVVIGLDGRIISANPALGGLLGYDPAELHDTPAGLLLGLDAASGLEDAAADDGFLERMARGEIGSFATTTRYRRSDACWVWLAYDFRLARRDDGEPRCVIGRIREVSGAQDRDSRTELAVRALTVENVRLARQRDAAESAAGRYAAVFDGMPDTVAFVFDEEKRIVAVRGTMLGPGASRAEEVVGKRSSEVFDRRDAGPLDRYVVAALEGQRTTIEVHARTFGTDVLLDVLPVEHGSGRREAIVVARDVGSFREREDRMRQAEERWRSSFEEAPVAMAEVESDARIRAVNVAFTALTGRSASELVGTSLLDLVHPDDRAEARRRLSWGDDGPTLGQDAELRVLRPDGADLWVESRSAALVSNEFGGDNVVVHWVDVSAQKAADQALAAARAHFAALVEHSSDVITVLDAEMRLTYASPAFARVFGTDPADMIGRPLTVLAHDEDVQTVNATLDAVAAHPSAVLTFEARFLHEDGKWRNIEATVSNLMENPAVEGLVCNCRDVTDRVQLADWLAHQAAHDPLTGLANRALLRDRMNQALARIKRSGARCAVMFIDLDHFKEVNDSRGHSAGDQLLVAIADRIRTVMRPNDTVARYGGDEFVVLAEDIPDEQSALALADRVLDAVVAPVVLFDDRVSVSASIGVAVSMGHTAEALLDEADAALYEAKRLGRNRSALASGND